MTTLRSRPDLLDLRSVTNRWRVRLDAEGLPVIPGRRGNVSAHDLTTLCVYVAGRSLPALLRNLPDGWRRHQTGDHEANILAPLTELDRAAEVVRAYRRRTLSPEQRAALSERARNAKPWQLRGKKAPLSVEVA
jgi:hypothetical protein